MNFWDKAFYFRSTVDRQRHVNNNTNVYNDRSHYRRNAPKMTKWSAHHAEMTAVYRSEVYSITKYSAIPREPSYALSVDKLNAKVVKTFNRTKRIGTKTIFFSDSTCWMLKITSCSMFLPYIGYSPHLKVQKTKCLYQGFILVCQAFLLNIKNNLQELYTDDKLSPT